MNTVEVSSEGSDESDDPHLVRHIQTYSATALEHLNIDGWELSVHLCGDETITHLNRMYRRKDGPTDVLSFSQFDNGDYRPPDGEMVPAGDIVVALPQAKKNARNSGSTVDAEIGRLVVHGILHLAGYDHGEEDTDGPMFDLQNEILALLRANPAQETLS